ncbi:Hypp1434 [Branchiostoma lanceolatum]|uniref:Hypp1434 protein n=1 Tax=Branchiostoma lanceolatum TaxID=7740 RepID=A0A8J9ZHU8_BRALA|nr:Hypp1434 [Branchiostoma lanceolatum]
MPPSNSSQQCSTGSLSSRGNPVGDPPQGPKILLATYEALWYAATQESCVHITPLCALLRVKFQENSNKDEGREA